MTTVNEDISPLGKDVPYRRTIAPDYLSATFVGDDANDHVYKVCGQGKGRMTVCVNNATDKTATVTVYGAHSATAAIGDAGVVELGGSGESVFTVLTVACDYETYNDPFPYYIIKITLASGPDGEDVTLYVNFQTQ